MSTDGGAVWTKTLQPTLRLYDLVQHPTDSDTLYSTGHKFSSGNHQMFLLTSFDGGVTWPSQVAVTPIAKTLYNTCFDVARSNPSVMYMCGFENERGIVYKTTDGVEWVEKTGNLQSLLPQYEYINDLWIAPDDPDFVLLATDAGVIGTIDGGDTWSAMSFTGKANDFAYCPSLDTVYAATSYGVHASADHGGTWTTVGTGLIASNVNVVAVDSYNGYVFAGTNAGAAWRCDVQVPLGAYTLEISEVQGGSVDFAIDAGPANAGRKYMIVGGITGSTPGMPLPGNMVTLPVNWDLFSDLEMMLLNTVVFSDFMGFLDAEGMGAAQMNLPPLPPGSEGTIITLAYCCNGPFDYVSNSVEIEVVR